MEKLFVPETLALFLTFFVPGFVMLKVWDQIVPGARRDFSKSLFEAIGYSAINLGVFLWLIALMRTGRLGVAGYFVAAFVILVGAPAFWPFLLRAVLSSERLAKYVVHPYEQPWDFVFGKHEPYWAIVHLKDGRRIGGRFGYNSFASSNPAAPQIFLEEVWKLDEAGVFTELVQGSEGIVILEGELLAVEFFRYYEDEGSNAEQQKSAVA